VRRFEYLDGGSRKFWEVGQDGVAVTVRYGRLGTEGQVRTTELATAAAAAAHVEKLVAGKVGKGYVEAGPGPSAPSGAVGGTAPAAGPAPLPDETTFVLPRPWAKRALPFRGLRPAPEPAIDAAATRIEAHDLRQQFGPRVRPVLEHPQSDPELVRHAGLPGDPLGVAVELVAMIGRAGGWREGRRQCAVLVDDLVLAHGPAFAAEFAAHLADLTLDRESSRAEHRIAYWVRRWRRIGDRNRFAPAPAVLARVRAHLAAASDPVYADAVDRLAALRAGPPNVAVATGFLVPTEQAWVREDVAALASVEVHRSVSSRLLASITDPADVAAFEKAVGLWDLLDDDELFWTVVANLGTGAAGAVAALLPFRDTGRTSRRRSLDVLAALPTDAAFSALVGHLEEKGVRPVVLEAMRRFPVRAARVLAARSAGSEPVAAICAQLLRDHLLVRPELAELDDDVLGPGAPLVREAAVRSATTVPVAGPADLPDLLVTPPWERRRAARPAVVTGLVPPPGLAVSWQPGEREEWMQRRGSVPDRFFSDVAGAVADAVRGAGWAWHNPLEVLAAAPSDLVRPHLAGFTPSASRCAPAPLQCLLGRFGDEAVGFVLRIARQEPVSFAAALLPIVGAEVAALMADWLTGPRSLRLLARSWLERHPAAAARDLVPAAVGRPGGARAAAGSALRLLDRAGHRAVVRAAAREYGTEAAAAVEVVLDTDPLDLLPARIPARPGWLDPAHLPPVVLAGRSAALPQPAVGHLCTVLALCAPGAPYAGVEVVRAALDPTSLAELVWAVFERWAAVGFPTRDKWVLEALALCGDDGTVRRLAPLIRAWPGEGGHARAVAALDVLAEIGTDVAMMHLHGIAEKVKFPGLRTRARERMAEVADGLGLTAEQLADRLVPAFGLDSRGTMVLDYGPRRFVVGFDEQLKPFVAEEGGARRAALPAPSAADDPVLAPAARAAFASLKKEVRAIAADQVRRLERAMVRGRRWSAAEHRGLFAEHPLLWHLARRLVWATFDGAGAVTGSFRIAEDRTPADSSDTATTVADDSRIGVPHPLQLGEEVATWSDLFADYEILQPFPQLGRDTWALTPEEERATVLHRLDGVTVPTGRVLGLAHRGWERGDASSNGVSDLVHRPLPDGLVAVVELDPGIIAGAATEWAEQKVTEVWLSDGPAVWKGAGSGVPFSRLDRIAASELLRDLEHLRG
jgi:predicted DNA-binding WGR domain protein